MHERDEMVPQQKHHKSLSQNTSEMPYTNPLPNIISSIYVSRRMVNPYSQDNPYKNNSEILYVANLHSTQNFVPCQDHSNSIIIINNNKSNNKKNTMNPSPTTLFNMVQGGKEQFSAKYD
eukprot:7132150-Ditylum_brightwellii.AAC.1